MALNGGSAAQYSSAFYVDCATQDEVDHLWERLSEGGEKGVCGWLRDRYGVSWNIVPSILGISCPTRTTMSGRVMQAMLKMTKLDVAELQRAYEAGE